MEPQNPSNFSDIACTSKVKRGKNYEKKRKRKEASDEGFGWYVTADLDQESSDHSSGQTKRARESSDSLSSTTNSHRNVDNMKSLMICNEAKPRKRRLAQAPQLVMLGL